MQTFATYYQALKTNTNEYLNYVPASFSTTEYSLESLHVETPTLYQTATLLSDCISTVTESAAVQIYSENGTFPSAANLSSKVYESFFNEPYKAMVAACMFFVNYFFPITTKTVCDVSVNYPTTSERVLDFFLEIFYVIDKDALEKVTATIKCIEIPTGREYLHTLVTAVVYILTLSLFLPAIDKIKRAAHNLMPVLHDEPGQAGPAEQRVDN
ncbi:hypothetical protein HPULCUR_003814 [Helicostylum pulchrum]|uniref:Uncharacterized protein n=1 Tax=Helicostylum pulchrum TaxID=562976 RepID=A0ABP9XUF2_9FUNG